MFCGLLVSSLDQIFLKLNLADRWRRTGIVSAMDSFYDAPRRPPFLPPRDRLSAPVVPEVSVLGASNDFEPYRSWKLKQNPYHNRCAESNKENISQNTSYLKKQVRFESPQQKSPVLAAVDSPRPAPVQTPPTFEQIYMANIPNRHLDLSIIDLPRNVEQKESKQEATSASAPPETYRQFLESQKSDNKIVYNDSVTDILNYKRRPQSPVVNRKQVDLNQCKCAAVKRDEEPSIKELLQIIAQQGRQLAQQNEQILLLQKQVSALLPGSNTRAPQAAETGRYLTSTKHETYRFMSTNNSPRKRGLPKFSIDLMRSFEVSFRPPQNNIGNAKDCDDNREPVIEEITETEAKDSVDTSMVLHDLIPVREGCPSPDPSIKIDMNDYEDSDEDDVCSEVDTTFYQNLMDQVNNILRKARIRPRHDNLGACKPCQADKLTPKTVNKVKEATLRHLRGIGIDVPGTEDTSSGSSDGESYDHNKISFVVKQLLMKYLPDEHLARAAKEGGPTATPMSCPIPNRPEFSFATVQYMKKYNLLTSNPDPSPVANKILDVTALKNLAKLPFTSNK